MTSRGHARAGTRGAQIGLDHAFDELLEADSCGVQPSRSCALRGVADVRRLLRRRTSEESTRRWRSASRPTHANAVCGELGDRVRDAAGEDVIVGLILLQHQPGAAHRVSGERPVAHGLERADRQLLLQAEADRGGRPGDPARDELLGPAL